MGIIIPTYNNKKNIYLKIKSIIFMGKIRLWNILLGLQIVILLLVALF
jgi:hypothetical protein